MNELEEIKVKLKDGEDYYIVKDILKDKRLVSGGSEDPDSYYFYFEKTFKLYNEYFSVSGSEYNDFEEGLEYYLVIKKDSKYFYDCYSSKEYKLSEEQGKKVIDAEELPLYTKLTKRVVEFKEEQTVINKENLINTFYHKKLINIFALITAAFIGLTAYLFYNHHFSFGLLVPDIILLITTTIIFIVNYRRKSAILKDNFKIVKDKVIAINETLSFKDTNYYIEFKLEKLGINITEKFVYFGNVNVGDELYVVFIRNKKKKTYKTSTTIVELLTE